MSDSCVTPRTPLVEYDEAIRLLLEQATPVEVTETVTLGDAAGRVLAGQVTSPVNVPPLDNSAMDGYAVRSADVEAGKPSEPRSISGPAHAFSPERPCRPVPMP
jgi:molybdopterin molybdotransferase